MKGLKRCKRKEEEGCYVLTVLCQGAAPCQENSPLNCRRPASLAMILLSDRRTKDRQLLQYAAGLNMEISKKEIAFVTFPPTTTTREGGGQREGGGGR